MSRATGPGASEDDEMRVIVLAKVNEDGEKGALPTAEEFSAMGAFDEELVREGRC